MITILMDQNAIEEALTNYTESDLGVSLSDKKVSIKLIAGRGGNGLRAEVSIAPRDELNCNESVIDSENDVEIPDDSTADDTEVEEPAIGPKGPFD